MKRNCTRPKPIIKKSLRNKKTDWDLLEALDLQADHERRNRKLSDEVKKLLGKK